MGKVFDIIAKLSREEDLLSSRLAPWKLNNDENKTLKRFLSFAKAKRTLQRFRKRNENNRQQMTNERLSSENGLNTWRCLDIIFREFDPGSGRTLAACLTHASRTMKLWRRLRPTEWWISGGRVSNAWVTCLSEGNNIWKRMVIPHNVIGPHDLITKGAIRWKMDSRPIS